MTRMLIAFARGCYHGLCRSTTERFRFGTPLENVDSLSSSPHDKLRDTSQVRGGLLAAEFVGQ